MEADEVYLKDYINVILKRKWIIITVFLVSVITTGIVSFIMPRVYETSAIIENGYIGGDLISKKDSKIIITSSDMLNKAIKESGVNLSVFDFRKMVEVKNIKDTGYIKLTARAESPRAAKDICLALANAYTDYGNRLYRRKEDLVKEGLAGIDGQIKEMESNMADIKTTITKLSSSGGTDLSDAALKMILFRGILSSYMGQLRYINASREKKRGILACANEFRIIDKPIEPQYPIRPRKKLNIAVSAALSLIIGIFLAFFTEYWKEN